MGTPGNTPLKLQTAPVNFKDLNLSAEDLQELSAEAVDVGTSLCDAPGSACTGPASNCDDAGSSQSAPDSNDVNSPTQPVPTRRVGRTKQVIIMVGLPGRGKTFLCNKLKRYLNWLGHCTKHINVGSYRRLQKADGETQNAEFFDPHNKKGMETRNLALEAALVDLDAFLNSEDGQVVIFDATNSTRQRRRKLVDHFHGRYQYLFIESLCNDPSTLESNFKLKMMYSPDYKGMDPDEALEDFHRRLAKYEEVYEPLDDRSVHYIKLINMVTGRGHMDINRISGYIPGKVVFFLMQICKAGMAHSRKIWLTRHGESEYNQQGRIGGDSGLSPLGQEYAHRLLDVVVERLPLANDEEVVPMSVWTSTLKRTIQTAACLPFPKLRWKALDEIHAGCCDGLTYEQIEERFPDEFAARGRDKLRYRYPAGESYMDVIQRLEPVVIEMERERECICVVGHQAVLRAILGYFTNTPLEAVPMADIPLHTLVELSPRPDGDMEVVKIPVDMSKPACGAVHAPPPAPLPAAAASPSCAPALPPRPLAETKPWPSVARSKSVQIPGIPADESTAEDGSHVAGMSPVLESLESSFLNRRAQSYGNVAELSKMP